MKVPPIAWHRAESLDDALTELAADDARILAGGQSLMPLMALRMSSPEVLIDIGKAPDLQGFTVTENAVVASAGVTARRIELSPEIGAAHPLLVAALSRVGHPEIRARGTLCGAVAHADPAAEMPALMLTVGGSVRIASATRRRKVRIEDFIAGPYMTTLEPTEMVAGIEIPKLSPSSGWSIKEIARRRGDFALVGVIAVVDVGDDGRVRDAKICLFGVAATARRAHAAENALIGQFPSDSLMAEAANRAFEGIDLLGDLHGSATYRRRAGAQVTRRALCEARDRAGVGHA